jgi:hypothetical protein
MGERLTHEKEEGVQQGMLPVPVDSEQELEIHM